MRAALVVLVALALPRTRAEAAPDAAVYVPKKDRARAGKTHTHGEVPAAGAKPVALLNLYSEHTREWLAFDPTAVPPDAAMQDAFLRDHFTNKAMHMDVHLVGFVVAAAKHFRVDMASIVSGFRHPKYNLMLRKKGHQVARDSQHTHGNAIDFFLPNVTTAELHAWAKAQRAGGVGLYLTSGFVHMDTGPIRFWSGD
jgi:uncharacterized protein YcbK (DUF882 family)